MRNQDRRPEIAYLLAIVMQEVNEEEKILNMMKNTQVEAEMHYRLGNYSKAIRKANEVQIMAMVTVDDQKKRPIQTKRIKCGIFLLQQIFCRRKEKIIWAILEKKENSWKMILGNT